MDDNWRERIGVDPNICHGKPCIRGTRILISVILDNLAAGESADAVVAAYGVQREDVMAALAYSAELAHERTVSIPPEADRAHLAKSAISF
jgi:uncharacterized protein (DUF433 family)